ncbi:MAG TPA: FtsX-like permease family protein, partial [Gemmatimonadaceae bacterium]
WGDFLVVCEVALALLMMVGAGLLVRSFYQIRNVDAGFDPRGVLATAFELNSRYDSATKVHAFASEFEARLRALPSVTGVALANNIPFNGTGYTSDYIAYGRPEGGYGTEIGHRTVSASYFKTMKVPLLRGRTFGPEDRAGATPVAIINDVVAQSYFKGDNPIGQRIAFDKVPTAKTNWYTIIGVVGSEHVNGLSVAPIAEAFAPETQSPTKYLVALVRTSGDPIAVAKSIGNVLHDLDPTLALTLVRTVDSMRDESMARVRFLTTLLLAFALIGVTLSVVGVYGVLAQLSRNRTREMGIRIALGAQASTVRWLVVRQGLQLTMVGLVLGGTIALFATRMMSSLLFSVTPRDPATLFSVSLFLAGTSVLAAWLPARKASRVDPMAALRAD